MKSIALRFFKKNEKPNVKVNYIYNVIYKIIAVIIPIITTPYLTGVLNAEGIGQVSYIGSFASYFVLFANFGFTYYAQRLIASLRNDKEKKSIAFFEILIARLITGGFSIFLYLILAIFNVYGDGYSVIVWIYAIPVVIVLFDVSFYFSGSERFKYIVLRDLAVKIVSTICIFILIKNANDVWIYALILVLSSAISILLLIPGLRNEVSKVDFRSLKPFIHLKKSFFLFLPLAAASIYPIVDKTIIGLFINDSATGCYSKAEQIISICSAFVTSMGLVASPKNSLLYKEGKTKELNESIYRAIEFVWFIGIPIMFGIIAVSSHMSPWYLRGEGFDDAPMIMKLLAPTILFGGFRTVFGLQYLMPTLKDKKFAISVTIGVAVNIAISIISAILFHSVLGVALASLLSEAVICLIMFLYVKKEFMWKKVFFSSCKYLISGVIVFAICFPLSLVFNKTIVFTFLIVFIGVATYFIFLLLLREKHCLSILEKVIYLCKELSLSKQYIVYATGVLVTTIFLSVLSYSPILLQFSINKYIYILWILVFVSFVPFLNRRLINLIIISISLLFLPFFVYALSTSFITKINYFESTLFRLIFLSGFIFCLGCMVSVIFTNKLLEYTLFAVILATLLASINIFVVYFNGFSFAERIYRYAGKNEISCFLLISICASSYLMKNRRVIFKIFLSISSLFLLLLLLMLKCRAVIVVLPVLLILEIINSRYKLNYRIVVAFLTIVSIVIVFCVPQLRKIIINDIVLGSRNPGDIDDISSGRLSFIIDAFNVFLLSPVLGVGDYYVDFGILEMIVSFGTLGLLLLLPLLIFPWFVFFKDKNAFQFKRLFLMLCITFYINHFFEGYPPFGPGVKTFILWLFVGVSFSFTHCKGIKSDLTHQARLAEKNMYMEISA